MRGGKGGVSPVLASAQAYPAGQVAQSAVCTEVAYVPPGQGRHDAR